MPKLTPIKAIRAKCLDCCGGSAHEVRLCPAVGCPLYAYRLGHRPKREESYTPENEASKNPAQGGGSEGR